MRNRRGDRPLTLRTSSIDKEYVSAKGNDRVGRSRATAVGGPDHLGHHGPRAERVASLGNISAKLPEEAKPEVLAHVRVRDAPTYEAGHAAAAAVLERFGALYTSAVRCFGDDGSPTQPPEGSGTAHSREDA
jgi:hypothetical protein